MGYQLAGRIHIGLVLHVVDGGLILGKEIGHCLGVLLNKLGAGHHAAHGQRAVAQLIPGVRQGDGLLDRTVLGHQSGGSGDGEHADGAVGGDHLSGYLLGGEPLDGHIVGGVHAVLGEQIVENVLGIGALAGGVDGLAGQVSQGGDAHILIQNVQHAKSVHRQHLDGAVGLSGEVGGHVGGDGGNVHLAGGEGGLNLAVVGDHLSVIVVQGGARLVVGEQLGRAHAGGAGEDHQIDLGAVLRVLAGGLGGAVRAGSGAVVGTFGAAASQQGQGECGAQEQREFAFHNIFLSF